MAANNLSGEIWKSVEFADGYSVSSHGRFRRDKDDRNWRAGPRKPYTCNNGYQYVRLVVGGEYKKFWLHRLVAMVFHGPPSSDGLQAAHIDGNPSNNRASNIRWATPSENNADKRGHGTYALGMATTGAKLTDEAVRLIRQSDLSGTELAEMFGVTRRTIDRARNGQGWPHIETPPVRRKRGIYHHRKAAS